MNSNQNEPFSRKQGFPYSRIEQLKIGANLSKFDTRTRNKVKEPISRCIRIECKKVFWTQPPNNETCLSNKQLKHTTHLTVNLRYNLPYLSHQLKKMKNLKSLQLIRDIQTQRSSHCELLKILKSLQHVKYLSNLKITPRVATFQDNFNIRAYYRHIQKIKGLNSLDLDLTESEKEKSALSDLPKTLRQFIKLQSLKINLEGLISQVESSQDSSFLDFVLPKSLINLELCLAFGLLTNKEQIALFRSLGDLKQLNNLSLKIFGGEIKQDVLQLLISSLNNLPSLSSIHLNLDKCYIEDNDKKILTQYLNNLSQVSVLKLKFADIKRLNIPFDLQSVSFNLQNLKLLSDLTLKIEEISFSYKDLQRIFLGLKEIQNLRFINFDLTKISKLRDESLEILAESFDSHLSLSKLHLNLPRRSLNDKILELFSLSISKLQLLTDLKLDFSENELSNEALDSLFSAINKIPGLTKLAFNLSNPMNQLTLPELAINFPDFSGWKNLVLLEIDISSFLASSDTISSLSRALKIPQKLANLSLKLKVHENVTDQALQDLISSLGDLAFLRNLNLELGGARDLEKYIKILGEDLLKCRRLEFLNFHFDLSVFLISVIQPFTRAFKVLPLLEDIKINNKPPELYLYLPDVNRRNMYANYC